MAKQNNLEKIREILDKSKGDLRADVNTKDD